MANLKVQVTTDDISNGVACDSGSCPIARAASRALPSVFTAFVGLKYVSLEQNNKIVAKIRHVGAVEEFIKEFDLENKGEPFEFTLEVPDELL